MSKDLLQRICDIPEDYGSIAVNAVERKGDDLHLILAVTSDEDLELPADIVVQCYSYKEATVAPHYYDEIFVTGDHPLLWYYTEPDFILSFYGEAANPLAVIGELVERHTQLVEDWIPFRRYLNSGNLSELIAGRYGMLANGPQPLIVAYEEVMQRHGFSTSNHQSGKRFDRGLSVLTFDSSFIIAERFEAIAL